MLSFSMIRNYLVTALRVLRRDTVGSIITVVSLSLSLAAALLLGLYVWDETHFDANQRDLDRLFRVESDRTLPGRPTVNRLVSPAPALAVLRENAAVEQAEHLYMQWSTLAPANRPTEQFNQRLYSASSGFFDLFEFEAIAGDPRTVTANPEQVAITETLSDRLFPNENALGQSILVDGQVTLVVGAVLRAMRSDSHFGFDIVTSTDSAHIRGRDGWDQNWSPLTHTYVKLTRADLAPSLTEAMRQWLNSNLPPQAIGDAEYPIGDLISLTLRPVSDIHLQKTLSYTVTDDPMAMKPAGDADTLTAMIVIALVILAIGSINYVNLATARALTRTREVAMRKVAGASQRQLVVQFLGESVVYVGIGLALALAVSEIALGPINDFTGKQLTLGDITEPRFVALCVGMLALTSLAAGLYPAFYLAAIRPREIWTAHTSRGGLWVRKTLVVAQFTISITLLICTLIFEAQTRFAQELKLGYTTDNVIVIYGVQRSPASTIALNERMENAFRQDPAVLSVSGAASQPSWNYLDTGIAKRAVGGTLESLNFSHLSVDLDYFETFQIQRLAGRLFSPQFAGDRVLWNVDAPSDAEVPVVINRSAVRTLGYSSDEEVIDQSFTFEFNSRVSRPVRVIGVVADVHFKTVRSAIAPMLYYPDPTRFNAINVRLDPDRLEQGLAHIDQAFNQVLSDQAVSRDFVAEQIRSQYRPDERRVRLFAISATLAMLIACLGLYGLAAFSAARKTKEVTLRKIAGATTGQLVNRLVWQFSTSVLIANIIAWPVAWLLTRRWLEQFAYRIELGPDPFILAGLGSLLIAAGSVVVHAIRVANTRPALALRYE